MKTSLILLATLFLSFNAFADLYTCKVTLRNSAECTAVCPKGTKVTGGGCSFEAKDQSRVNDTAEVTSSHVYPNRFGPIIANGTEGYFCSAESAWATTASSKIYQGWIELTATAICQ